MAPRFALALSAALLSGCMSPVREPGASIARPAVHSTDGEDGTYPVPGRAPQGLTVFRRPKGSLNLHRLVVLIHGGGWVSGNRQEMDAIAHFFVRRGFVAATIDYTLARDGERWPAQLLDCQAAVRFLRAHAKSLHIDPNQIGAAGVSAGGHLALWLAVSDAPVNGISSRVQMVGSISGVLDLTQPLTREGDAYQIVEKLLSDELHPTLQQKRDASPVFCLDQTTPPLFLIQGMDDPLVPTSQSTEAEQRMRALGRPVEFRLVPRMGHGIDVAPPAQRAALDALADWMTQPQLPPSNSDAKGTE